MRPIRTTTLALTAIVLLAGCRQTRPEAGLPGSAYRGLLPRVVSNERGFWFLITPANADFQPFVSIGEGDDREVYYAIPRGSRTLRLMPLTPFSYSSLDAKRNQRVTMEWLETPAAAGPDLPDAVGWMEAAGQPVAWAGAKPADGAAVTLASGKLGEELTISSWLAGRGTVKGASLGDASVREGASGPFVVLPDGAVPTRPIRVATAEVEPPKTFGVEVSSVKIEKPPRPAGRFTTQPAALRAGVDALLSPAETGRADVTLARPILRNGLALSLTDEAINVELHRTGATLLALRDIANGRDLAAAQTLFELGIQSGRNAAVAPMRIAELVAAAGYVDWSRNELVQKAPGLDGDVALYLSRAHFVAGDWRRAKDFAERAQERFASWQGAEGKHGSARSLVIRAQLAARDADWETAFELLVDAGKIFDEVADPMRAAEAELLAASYSLRQGNAVNAVKAAALARSRFFHGHSPFYAAFAELALADIYLQAGETSEAEKMVAFAAKRFEEQGDSVGRNRARIAQGRVVSKRAPAQGVRSIQMGLEDAQTAGDFVGVVDAASSLTVLGSVPKEATANYGLVIAVGVGRTTDPYVRERAARALTLLCGRGMAESVGKVAGASPRDIAIARAACGESADVAPSDAGTLASLVSQGWRAYLGGNVDDARSLASKAVASVTEATQTSAPRVAADALFLDASLNRDIDAGGSEQTVIRALRILGDAIDPDGLAAVLGELAESHKQRGQYWLAAELFRAATSAAGDRGQGELRRGFAMQRVETLHGAGELDAAGTAIRDAEPVLESAGAASAPLLARLWVLQEDVLTRRGRAADAEVSAKKVEKALAELDAAAQMDVRLERAELAAARGDVAVALVAVNQAEAQEADLADGLVGDATRKLILARASLVRGDVAVVRGELSTAAGAYLAAGDALADLASTDEVVRLRIASLVGTGRTTASDDVLAGTIRQLESIRAEGNQNPASLPRVTAALADLEISSGRPSRALAVLKETTLSGAATAPTAAESFCLDARATILSGSGDTGTALERCAQMRKGEARVDATLLAALTAKDATPADMNREARALIGTDAKDLSRRDVERLRLVSEIAAGTSHNEATAKKLRAAVESARGKDNAKKIAAAVKKAVVYDVQTGRAESAGKLLEANAGAFYDLGGEGPGTLAYLRSAVMLRGMKLIEASSFAQRALSETPDMSKNDQAETHLLVAQNSVLLGMWQRARRSTANALQAAKDARNRKLQRRIEGFAKRFSIPH